MTVSDEENPEMQGKDMKCPPGYTEYVTQKLVLIVAETPVMWANVSITRSICIKIYG